VPEAAGPAPRAARLSLGFAGAGVLLGAADTYVVVVALPAIMSSVGVDISHLQQATPIVSGFLLGYVAVLPLLGRLSDLCGRTPVLTACLVIFAAGSLITASATSLGAVVAGRTLQGAGGGGLVPVTLALVADLWPPRRRGVPLGVVGAVQEFGSVAGPLYGAALSAASTWRAIFYVNLPLAAAIAAGVNLRPRPDGTVAATARRLDVPAIALAVVCVATTVLAVAAPPALADSVSVGTAFVPLLGDAAVTTPLALIALLSGLGLVARELAVPATVRPLIPLRGMARGVRRVDLVGGLLVALVLGCVVVSFATADPQLQVVGTAAPALLPAGAVLAALFVVRELRVAEPLVDLRALRDRAAFGSLAANLAVGAALMAALVDIPVFARATVDAGSQLAAALVLARLLIAVPIGAVLGGALVGRFGYRVVAGAGMVLAAGMFALMAGWTATTLADPLGAGWLHPSDLVLVGCGLGFGLSIVPVTAAILGAVPQRLHGIAASLTVAARMVGMLTGLSLLTAIGLRRFYSVQAMLPHPISLCPNTPLNCPAYDTLERGAILDELHVVFLGAAACALLAAALATSLLRRHGEGDGRRILSVDHA
jgi:MFS family permease